MRQILLFCSIFLSICGAQAQDISVRVRQMAFSAADPDGAGPATGSVTFQFELKSSLGEVLADGMGLSVVYQSASLLATPVNNVTKSGPINTVLWSQQVDNRTGNAITPVTYDGQVFDKRMIITFNQNSGVPDAVIGTDWTAVAQLTYYTLGNDFPQGGYIVPEPATIVAQNELSSDGGLTTYPYLSPEAEAPLPLGANTNPLPVQFVRFEAACSPGGNKLGWTTAYEKDNAYFEVLKSVDGSSWNSIGRVNGSGNSGGKTYEFMDALGGTAQYRIKQVDANGATSYSAIARTNCPGSSLYVNLYPVPARDRLTLVVNSDKEAKTNVHVVDNNGRVVMSQPLTVNRGANSFTLDVSRLAQGQYYLKSDHEDVRINHRFTIVR